MNQAVFLDRDGVINLAAISNGRPYPPATIAEFELLPGVVQATQSLSQAGYKLIVVTNQPDVAAGVQKQETVENMHQLMRQDLPIHGVKVCYHQDSNDCHCRKPKPGMLLDASAEWLLDLQNSYIVGDRWRDIEAGKAAGCRTILVESHYDERQAEHPDAVVTSLLEASELILSGSL